MKTIENKTKIINESFSENKKQGKYTPPLNLSKYSLSHQNTQIKPYGNSI